MQELTTHEVAKLFPMMDVQTFESLKTDISANGLIEPIWIYDNQIIDGRNRYKACQELGIEPQFRVFGGEGSLVQFVISLNLNRRHLTIADRAAIAVKMLPMLEAEAKERQFAGLKKGNVSPLASKDANGGKEDHSNRASHIAGKMMGVSGAVVDRMKAVVKVNPKLAEEVTQGNKTVNQAYNEIKPKKEVIHVSEAARPDPDILARGKYSTAGQFARMAISQLTRIERDDPQRVAALMEVKVYIEQQISQGE